MINCEAKLTNLSIENTIWNFSKHTQTIWDWMKIKDHLPNLIINWLGLYMLIIYEDDTDNLRWG